MLNHYIEGWSLVDGKRKLEEVCLLQTAIEGRDGDWKQLQSIIVYE